MWQEYIYHPTFWCHKNTTYYMNTVEYYSKLRTSLEINNATRFTPIPRPMPFPYHNLFYSFIPSRKECMPKSLMS